MGLDMYAYVTDEEPVHPVDFDIPETESELHYWRKHPNLHGWMQALYEEKGGDDPDFNFAPVLLTVSDLNKLHAAILERTLPETSGFFFGESDGSERDGDLAFVSKAREAIRHGQFVYYYASW